MLSSLLRTRWRLRCWWWELHDLSVSLAWLQAERYDRSGDRP